MRFLIVFIVSLLMIPRVHGSGLRVDINSINQTGFPEIDINFTVFDTSGRVLQDIQRKNIRLHENGSKKIGRRRVGKECRSRWSPYH